MSKEVENNNGTIIEFLLGEKSFNNAWFGDMIGGVQFWWRSELRKQSQQDKKRIKELESEIEILADISKKYQKTIEDWKVIANGLESKISEQSDFIVELRKALNNYKEAY
jgi:hypothetical protein